MHNAPISNYSCPDYAHLPYVELFITSLCKSFHDPYSVIYIYICKWMFFHYSYPLLLYEIPDMQELCYTCP